MDTATRTPTDTRHLDRTLAPPSIETTTPKADRHSSDDGGRSLRQTVRDLLDRSRTRLTKLLGPIWRDWRIGTATAAGLAVGWGITSGTLMPRGPLTTAQTLTTMAVSALLGLAAGLLMRSRWAMLLAPALFVATVELSRIDAEGPTVDGFSASTYGILALVVGRGFHGLVALLPMIWASSAGAGVARRLDPDPNRPPRRAGVMGRRFVSALVAVGLVALTAVVARPARTAPIVDANGERVPGSITELTTADINGHDLALLIRGHSTDNPVLLFLAGGPGGSEMGAMRNHLPDLERHFTVVTFDQRGTGKSYQHLDPISTLTLESAVDDALAVTNHLRDRFDQDRIYLAGQSWGSLLGVLAIQEQPELYQAFIGVGQMVSPLDTDQIFYKDTLEWARARGDDELVDELVANGPPPYDDMVDYEAALSHEHDVYPYDHASNHEGEGGFSENLFVEEFTFTEQVHALGAFMDTFNALYPQIQHVDLRETATEFDIPVFFVQGAHEADGRAEPFADWYPTIDAPTKDLVVFDTSGHRPLWEQPDEFVTYMTDTVLAATPDPAH